MSRGAAPVLVWAAFLAVLLGVLVVWTGDWLAELLLAAAVTGAWLVAVLLRRQRVERIRLLGDLSLTTVAVAGGLILLALGALLGRWLVLIGAGAALAGGGGLVRERLAVRRAARGRQV